MKTTHNAIFKISLIKKRELEQKQISRHDSSQGWDNSNPEGNFPVGSLEIKFLNNLVNVKACI